MQIAQTSQSVYENTETQTKSNMKKKKKNTNII